MQSEMRNLVKYRKTITAKSSRAALLREKEAIKRELALLRGDVQPNAWNTMAFAN